MSHPPFPSFPVASEGCLSEVADAPSLWDLIRKVCEDKPAAGEPLPPFLRRPSGAPQPIAR